jgi:hypothetical protein
MWRSPAGNATTRVWASQGAFLCLVFAAMALGYHTPH